MISPKKWMLILSIILLNACGGSGGGSDPTPVIPDQQTPPSQQQTPATAPSIVNQPSAAVVSEGQTATFSVVANGTAPLTFQWQRNGQPIAGANGSSYVTPATSLSDSGATFDVVISNTADTLTSNAVLLTVNPLPPALALAPTGVDTDTQSYLVSMSTGPYTDPSSVGRQYLATQGDASIEAIPGAQTSGAPSQYDTTWTLNDFYHIYFYSLLSVATQALPLKYHSQALIEGFNLDRYDGGLSFNGSILFETLLIGIRSDLNDVGIGHWKYRGAYQNGYFYGYPLIRGAYIVGEPAIDSAVAAINDGTYSGFSYGGLEREHSGLQNFQELTAQAFASYDATTHKVTISIHDFTGYSNLIMTDFGNPGRAWLLNNVWAYPSAMDQTPASVFEFTCTAAVDPLANFFTCNLANSAGTVAGIFKGKFYGTRGDSIGGTYALDNGAVGAIALQR